MHRTDTKPDGRLGSRRVKEAVTVKRDYAIKRRGNSLTLRRWSGTLLSVVAVASTKMKMKMDTMPTIKRLHAVIFFCGSFRCDSRSRAA